MTELCSLMSTQPLELCVHKSDTNAWKLPVFMTLLGVPYTLRFSDDYNDSNFYPQLLDPNTKSVCNKYNFILKYLKRQYDTKRLFAGKDIKEEVDILAWLFFQVSGFSPARFRVDWFLSRGMDIQSTISSYDVELRRLYQFLGPKLHGKEFVKDLLYVFV